MPTNGASLAAFRIAVGLVMSLEALALCLPNPAAISAGTTPLETYYTGANITFHLPYPAFHWLPLLPPTWIHLLVGVLAVAGLMMAIGLFYRLSAALVFLTWGYLWVVESTRTYWQSHYYLEVLLTFLLIWMPAARRYSVDAWRARHRHPPRTVPYWTILLLRGQLVIAYFYAGVAKLSTDWLLDAAPTRWVLADPAITRPYEAILTAGQLEFFRGILQSPGLAHFISWTGCLFDLAVGFLLLARRTRLFGLALMVIFHATNHFIIFDDIGWFPLVGVATALIFLNPDWPERLASWLRKPRWVTPDRNWFSAGAVLFPVVGATLGWKAAPPEASRESGERPAIRRGTTIFVTLWLVWQALMPLRHYWIAGDGRFTYEGMSFSWRLKGEARHALGHQLYIQDPAILAGPRLQSINWSGWHGDKVLYRRLDSGRIDWSQFPEILVLLEPLFGERILYNPGAGPGPATETAIRERIRQLWMELHGRPPDAVRPSQSLSQVFESLGTVLRSAGRESSAAQATVLAAQLKQIDRGTLPPAEAMNAVRGVRALIQELQTNAPGDKVTYALRGLEPFAMEGTGPGAGAVYLIEDAAILKAARGNVTQISREHWKNGTPMRNPQRASDRFLGGDVMVVHVGDIGIAGRDLLPQSCIFDSQDQPKQAPYIWWNSPKDLTVSKGLHVSIQAFFLRRYAQRVAGLWEKEYGRRPKVNAYTAVSLNGRPPQLLVDPEVDLAGVPVSWFRHNQWIRDLETPRIPRELLAKGRVAPGFSSRTE
jgi:uncharacterized membrane protein YphA (DoxX/SURF4 family)